jgi:hypothetical protein
LHIARPRRIALAGGAGVAVATLALVALPAPRVFAYSDMRTDRVPTPIVHRTTRPVESTSTSAPRRVTPPPNDGALTLPAFGTAMIVGDSGMFSATPAFTAALDAARWRVVETAYPGIGLSRLSDRLQHQWSNAATQYQVDLTIVMLGSWDVAWQEQHGADAYRELIEQSLAAFRAGGGKVLWLSALPGGDPDASSLDHFYADLEARYPGVVDYLDIEPALRGPEGDWPREVGGRVLRQLDGWHLCPDGADAVTSAALAHVGLATPAWQGGLWRSDGRYEAAHQGCPG